MYYIGLDVHKRTISYCVKDVAGKIFAEGKIPATRLDLDRWMKSLPQPWTAAMEATVFTGWVYDHLQPHAAGLKVAHPLMLRAIAAAKKKNDRIDAHKICDCLRCDFLPECYMAPTALRERRRTLRYRNLLVRQMVQTKNKISTLLMEAGVSGTSPVRSRASFPASRTYSWSPDSLRYIRYAWMNGSKSPSKTFWTSPRSNFVRWSLIIW
jgi:transposase